jgi:RNA polymerase sigma-70 factor (ECF subfamily)
MSSLPRSEHPAERQLPTLDITTREVIRVKARQIFKRAGLTRSDLPDLEQDITLHVWRRLGRFDPDKADRCRFTRMLIGHAVATVLRDRKRWTSRAPASMEAMLRHPGDRPLEPIDQDLSGREKQQALALDVSAVLAALPKRLRSVARVLKTYNVTATARKLGLTRAEVYRRLGEIREAFAEAGLKEYLNTYPDTSRAAGVVPM